MALANVASLSYLETGGEGAVVQPWVWIVWLLIGPVFAAMEANTLDAERGCFIINVWVDRVRGSEKRK